MISTIEAVMETRELVSAALAEVLGGQLDERAITRMSLDTVEMFGHMKPDEFMLHRKILAKGWGSVTADEQKKLIAAMDRILTKEMKLGLPDAKKVRDHVVADLEKKWAKKPASGGHYVSHQKQKQQPMAASLELGLSNGLFEAQDIDPVTRQRGRFIYRDKDGHSAFAIDGTSYKGPKTGIVYQLETHWVGKDRPAKGTKPTFWFMARDARGNIKSALSKKFSDYDEAAQHWHKMRKAALKESVDMDLDEVSPPGWSGTVKAMKDEPGITNPFALAWHMKKKGAKPHYKDQKKGGPVKKKQYRGEGFGGLAGDLISALGEGKKKGKKKCGCPDHDDDDETYESLCGVCQEMVKAEWTLDEAKKSGDQVDMDFTANPAKLAKEIAQKLKLANMKGPSDVLRVIGQMYDKKQVPNAVYAAAAGMARVDQRGSAEASKALNALSASEVADAIIKGVKGTSYGSIANFEKFWKSEIAKLPKDRRPARQNAGHGATLQMDAGDLDNMFETAIREGEVRHPAASEMAAYKDAITARRGKLVDRSGPFKYGQKVKYEGKSWLIYGRDPNAKRGEDLWVLVSPDFKKVAENVDAGELKEDSRSIGSGALGEAVKSHGWRNVTKTRDGYEKYDAVFGNAEAHAEGFASGPSKGDWDWTASVIEGPYKEKKGKAKSSKEAMRKAEAAAKKLGGKVTEDAQPIGSGALGGLGAIGTDAGYKKPIDMGTGENLGVEQRIDRVLAATAISDGRAQDNKTARPQKDEPSDMSRGRVKPGKWTAEDIELSEADRKGFIAGLKTSDKVYWTDPDKVGSGTYLVHKIESGKRGEDSIVWIKNVGSRASLAVPRGTWTDVPMRELKPAKMRESLDDLPFETRLRMAEAYDKMVGGAPDLSKEQQVDAEHYKRLLQSKHSRATGTSNKPDQNVRRTSVPEHVDLDEVFEDAAAHLTEKGSHYYDGSSYYADTAFLNAADGALPGMTLKHMGFGEFELTGKDGTIEFDRMRGKKFKGQSGRSHKVYDDKKGELVKKLIKAMEKKGKSELVRESVAEDLGPQGPGENKSGDTDVVPSKGGGFDVFQKKGGKWTKVNKKAFDTIGQARAEAQKIEGGKKEDLDEGIQDEVMASVGHPHFEYPGGWVALTDLAKESGLRGVHFGRIEKSVEALKKRGKLETKTHPRHGTMARLKGKKESRGLSGDLQSALHAA